MKLLKSLLAPPDDAHYGQRTSGSTSDSGPYRYSEPRPRRGRSLSDFDIDLEYEVSCNQGSTDGFAICNEDFDFLDLNIEHETNLVHFIVQVNNVFPSQSVAFMGHTVLLESGSVDQLPSLLMFCTYE